MRSQGQVRFIRLSSRVQAGAAAGACAVALAYVGSMGAMAISQWSASSEREALLEREAKIVSAESRVATYRDDIGAVARDLKKRQDFIEDMVDSLPEDAKSHETVSDSSTEADKTISKVSAAIPEAAELARIEARQLAFAEKLTRYADRRAEKAASAIRKLGLDPRQMLLRSDAQGGPLLRPFAGRNDPLDQRFERLGLSLARMEALERGLNSIPQFMPANYDFISSGFGYRRDPFTGGGAMHAGLDFRGPIGAPVHAAAQGVVSFAGRKSGYGNCLEISHGNGLMTRYAHLSRFSASLGQKVSAGDVIAAIGNSGRSTGPHLHFEVRIHDRAVNPRPFLESARHVLEEARSGEPGARG